jgi:hypothetical protein
MSPKRVDVMRSVAVRDYLVDTLSADDCALARFAVQRLGECQELVLLAGSAGPLPEDVEPSRSLQRLGDDWLLDPSEAREALAGALHEEARKRTGYVVSASQPAVRASDPFVKREALFVVRRDRVWATARPESGLEQVKRVVALSEGYPPGVIAVHDGPPWSPGSAVVFALSVFDGETFTWWR